MENELLYEQLTHTLDLIQNEINALRTEIIHHREMIGQHVEALEKQSLDHETRLRDATNGVTQFRLWSTLSSSGSALLSVTALIRSFFA